MSEHKEYAIPSLGSKEADDFMAQQGELQEYDDRKRNVKPTISDPESTTVNGNGQPELNSKGEDMDYPPGKEVIFIGECPFQDKETSILTLKQLD